MEKINKQPKERGKEMQSKGGGTSNRFQPSGSRGLKGGGGGYSQSFRWHRRNTGKELRNWGGKKSFSKNHGLNSSGMTTSYGWENSKRKINLTTSGGFRFKLTNRLPPPCARLMVRLVAIKDTRDKNK